MAWLFAAVALGVVATALAVSKGKFGSQAELVDQTPRLDLPERDLDGEDLKQVRFEVVTRGYSPKQVEELLDRLAVQLDSKEFETAKPEQLENEAVNIVTDAE